MTEVEKMFNSLNLRFDEYMEIMSDFEYKMYELENKNVQLEKALTMACEKLNGIGIDNEYGIGLARDCINGETSNYIAMYPKEYREYFLRKAKDE